MTWCFWFIVKWAIAYDGRTLLNKEKKKHYFSFLYLWHYSSLKNFHFPSNSTSSSNSWGNHRRCAKRIMYSVQSVIFKFLKIYWLRERERDLLFHLFTYSLVDFSVCSDWGLNPQLWCMRMTQTNWDTCSGPESNF